MRRFVYLFLLPIAVFLTIAFPIRGEEQPQIEEMKPSASDTHHIEVKPETLDGVRLPYMRVTISIVDEQNNEKKTIELHPMFAGNFHYGSNVSLEKKKYILHFKLTPPTFVRGENRKEQWLIPFEAEFPFDASPSFDDKIIIGEKKTRDMKISFEAEHPEQMFVLKNIAEEHMPSGHKTTEMQFPKEDSVSSVLIPTSYLLFALIAIAVAQKLARKRA